MTTTIEAHPDAPEGTCKALNVYSAGDFSAGSCILCRNTAPLISFAYSLLYRDLPCKVLGRNIGEQLASIVKKMRAINLEDFYDKLNVWHDREIARAVADDRNPERIEDQYECLRFFADALDEASRTVESLLAKIDLMFTDETNGLLASRITLSTIHKAKGLEFPVVFLLDFHKYLPSRFARQEWEMRQERNLQYVAVTRSMDQIYYISSDTWKETTK